MASARVLKCFNVSVNGNASLIVSNPTIFDLTWNWEFGNLSIFETTSIGRNMAILDNAYGYFNTMNSILSSFYGFQFLSTMKFHQYKLCNQCRYQAINITITMVKIQSIMLIYVIKIKVLLLYFCLLYIFSKM